MCPRPALSLLPLAATLCFALLLSACSSRVGTETIRTSIATGETSPLLEKMRKNHDNYRELVTALNLARIYQLEGQWRLSIAAFEEALVLLEEYEGRAVINVRGMFSGVGTILLARGSQGYYGTGYERSLLHTFNALNYMMLGDFSGAAVEMRRMELRQEMWLHESQVRLEQNLEKIRASRGSSIASADNLPLQYSMRATLSDPAVRNLVNSYQDSFSYALSSILCRLAGDTQYAEVSLRRAAALDDGAKVMFSQAWGTNDPVMKAAAAPSPQNKGRKQPAKTRGAAASAAGNLKHTHLKSPPVENEAPAAPMPAHFEPRIPALPPPVPDEGAMPPDQEVTVIAFTGLAPALRVEHIRIRFPVVGYLLLDLPSYAGAVRGATPQARCSAGNEFALYPLLRTDLLAYRTLHDEVRMEIASAVSRAMIRAGAAVAATAVAASHEDTRNFAPLAGLFVTALTDLFTTPFSASVRNWETLPNSGYIALTRVARGSSVTVGAGGGERTVSLPQEARGVIIMATQLSNANLRVDYVAY